MERDDIKRDTDYSLLLEQLEALTEGERDTIANLANASGALSMNLADGGLLSDAGGTAGAGTLSGKTCLPPHCAGKGGLRDCRRHGPNSAGGGRACFSGAYRLRRRLQLGDRGSRLS